MRRGLKKNRLLDYWVGIPFLNAATLFHAQRKAPASSPKKIGVLCSPALGDTLLFSAALQDVRAGFPDAEIVHCCMPQNQGAAAIIPGADRQLVFQLTKPHHALRLLRAERFDLMLDYTSWQRLTAFLTLHAAAAFTVGFKTAGMYRGRGYDLPVKHRRDLHEIDNFRSITRSVGIPADHLPRLAALRKTDLTRVWPHGFERPMVLMHLWPSGQKAWIREWKNERWLQLALALQHELPGVVFGITGTKSELPRTNPVLAMMAAAGVEAHAVICSFPDLASLLQHAALMVSVNTGVMHLAAIGGTPTVSINGPNGNDRWGPIGPRAIGVEAPGSGCGYLHLGFDSENHATDCMDRTTVEQVLAACTAVLAGQDVLVSA